MKKLLVFRYSAMGDVAILLPVLKGLLKCNPNIEVYLITRTQFFPFFQGIDRLYPIETDPDSRHKGVLGLFRLFHELRRTIKPDYVFDLHKVIRTYALDIMFRISGYKVIRFKKGRQEKKKMIRTKVLYQLPLTAERYASAFEERGFPLTLPAPPVFELRRLPPNFENLSAGTDLLIGIAPFSQHPQKVWGMEKTEDLIRLIDKKYKAKILLFGGGTQEKTNLEKIASKHENCIVSAHYFGLAEEIAVLPRLAVMISMDSANMHLTALAGVPTVSVWGATHPFLGFAPYFQPKENMIQYEGSDLPCRPCSVYGKKKCIHPSVKCMDFISADAVFLRVSQILGENRTH